MKILSILPKITSFAICFNLILYSNPTIPTYHEASGSTIDGRLIAPHVETPTIDGELDSAWAYPDVGMFALVDSNPPNGGAEDLSAWFKLGWNENGIYFFVHVEDDSIDTSPANSWETDCIEIFIDGKNEKADSLDDNDVQWRWVALEDTLALCQVAGENLRPAEYELAWTIDTGVVYHSGYGYNLELSIPEAGLEKLGTSLGIDLSEGGKFGFDLQVTDNDSTGADDALRWHATGGDDYCNPATWGIVKFGDTNDTLMISIVVSAPNIDGYLDDDWLYADVPIPEIGMTAIGGGVGNCPDSGSGDFSSIFRAAWNTEGFYVFGKVWDDIVYVADPVTDANEWGLDCWEVYFDGGNEKSGDYDANDVQYRFVYGQDTATQGPVGGFEVAWAETDIGYNFELSIPAATLTDTGITLAHNQVIGFEMQCTDNEGDGREGITKWWSSSNDSYQNSALFGTAILCDNWSGILSETIPDNIRLSISSLISSSTEISYTIPAKSSVKLNLYNISGQKIRPIFKGVRDPGTYTLYADLLDLANGVYLCNLETEIGSATKKVLVIK